jgi:protein required for attachment to host cells
LPTRALGTERPGRAMSSVGHGRSAYEQTDWHAQQEEAFLTQLTERLAAAVAAGKTKSLIVVAPPRALGVLRPAYPQGLKDAVRAEIDKDLVKLPVYEIEKHLRAG